MKKIIDYAIIGTISLIFCSSECKIGYHRIAVYNKAEHYINILLSEGYPIFPDTLIPTLNYGSYSYVPFSPIKPGLAGYFGKISTTYKDFIQSCGSDTIIIFIFHTDTLAKYTWDEVREGYKILKRYDVSWQEMAALDGEIQYPPTEVEKRIRQYPPYGSE